MATKSKHKKRQRQKGKSWTCPRCGHKQRLISKRFIIRCSSCAFFQNTMPGARTYKRKDLKGKVSITLSNEIKRRIVSKKTKKTKKPKITKKRKLQAEQTEQDQPATKQAEENPELAKYKELPITATL